MEELENSKKLSEILMHEGEWTQRNEYYHAVSPPIVQSSNFTYDTVKKVREVLSNERNSTVYTRGSNPTVRLLEQKIALLEHTEAALAFGSGSAAIAAAIIGNVSAGEHIICVQKPYAWTYKLINNLLSRFGVTATFVDGRDIENIKQARQSNTRVLMLESPNSLTFELQDISACATWAKANNITTIIDNSHASPLYQNPSDMGIDIIVHSGTKYLNGHSDVVWGALACTNEMATKLFHSELMTLGAIISPNDAWLVLRGLRTLALRVSRSSATAMELVAYLEKQSWVDYVLYPLLPSFPQYELAKKQMRGAGGLFSLNLKTDSMEKVEAFCNAMSKRFLMAVSWGGYESLQLPSCVFYNDKSAVKPPLPYTFVRYYAGLEDLGYLKEAFEEASKYL